MSDLVKLLDQGRALREAARRTRSVAQQLSRADDRVRVIRCALRIERQAVCLEQLADCLSGIESNGATPGNAATVPDVAGPEQGALKPNAAIALPD